MQIFYCRADWRSDARKYNPRIAGQVIEYCMSSESSRHWAQRVPLYALLLFRCFTGGNFSRIHAICDAP